MSAPKTSEVMIQSYFYKTLELDEYDETNDQIASFIEEQSKAYRQTLESAIKQHKITYRPEFLDRTIAHFKGLLDEAIQYSMPLQVCIYPKHGMVEYSIRAELAYLSLKYTCSWRDFILHGSLTISPNSTIWISTSLPDGTAKFKIKDAMLDFTLADSGAFKDFLISSELEITSDKLFTVTGKEICF